MNPEQIHTELLREYCIASEPIIARLKEKTEQEWQAQHISEEEKTMRQIAQAEASIMAYHSMDAAFTAIAQVLATHAVFRE